MGDLGNINKLTPPAIAPHSANPMVDRTAFLGFLNVSARLCMPNSAKNSNNI